MNCASLETMLADLVWIEEKSEQYNHGLFILLPVLEQVCLVIILVLIFHFFFPPHLRRLKWILKHQPNAAYLNEIHTLITELRKEYPQLETITPELDRLRFAPQPPSDEQLKDLYQTIRDICG